MTGIEKITSRIESDATAEAQDILEKSSANCESIRADYEKKSHEEYAKLVRAGVRDCEQRVSRLGKTAEMEARKSLLAVKQEMVSMAFERAKELILALPEDEYVAFLATQCVKAAHTGQEEVIFNRRDDGTVGKKVLAAANKQLKENGKYTMLTMSSEPRDFLGGVIVKEGDIEVNCTVEALANLYREELAASVAAALFD